MKIPFVVPRQIWFAVFGILLLAVFVWVALRSGPIAPIQVTVTQIVKGEVAPSLFGIGTVEARRVSIARALVVMRILNQMATQYQTAIIVVTHDEKIIPTFNRIYNNRDGRAFEEVGEGRALQ